MYKGLGIVSSSCLGIIGDRSELHDRNSAATFLYVREARTLMRKAFRNKNKT